MSRMKAFLTGGPQPVWLRYLLLIAAASGLVRFALGTPWMRESAVLYVLIPYLVGALIYVTTPHIEARGYWSTLWRHMRVALIVMLSTSLLLFEGFLCVVMFIPIYLVFAMLVALANRPRYGPEDVNISQARNGWDGLKASVLPALILILSLDGVRGSGFDFGPERAQSVTRTLTTDLTPDQLRANIINHTYPDEGRSRFLTLFPRPVSVTANSLDVGARHIAEMEYRRWGLEGINVHRGSTVMEFDESTDTRLHARFIHDDSYLSHYMRFETWALDMKPRSNGQTEVTLTVGYERLLAPSWYFGPLQKRVVGDGLDYALSQIIGARAS